MVISDLLKFSVFAYYLKFLKLIIIIYVKSTAFVYAHCATVLRKKYFFLINKAEIEAEIIYCSL